MGVVAVVLAVVEAVVVVPAVVVVGVTAVVVVGDSAEEIFAGFDSETNSEDQNSVQVSVEAGDFGAVLVSELADRRRHFFWLDLALPVNRPFPCRPFGRF